MWRGALRVSFLSLEDAVKKEKSQFSSGYHDQQVMLPSNSCCWKKNCQDAGLCGFGGKVFNGKMPPPTLGNGGFEITHFL